MHTATNEVPRHLAARVFHAVDIVEGGRRRTDAGTRLHTVRVNLACTRTIFPTICPPKLSTFDQRSTVPRRPRLDKDGFTSSSSSSKNTRMEMEEREMFSLSMKLYCYCVTICLYSRMFWVIIIYRFD